METTMNAEINLTRHSDTGNTITTVMFQHGMPNMIVIEQRLRGNLSNKVELTISEAKFFRYSIAELINMNKMATDPDVLDY